MRFLSPEWLAEARHAPPAPAVVIEQVVQGTPHGTVVYRVHAARGEAAIEWPVPERAPAPDLRITADWPTAVGVARGEISAQRALMQGRLKVSGGGPHDPGKPAVDDLVGLDPVPAELRARTTFEA